MDKDPPERYKRYVGKYVRITCHSSDVSGVILDDMFEIDGVHYEEEERVWCFRLYNVIPKKFKKHSYHFKANRFIQCLKSGDSYSDTKRALDWNRITEINIDDVRQKRNSLLVQKIMES